MNPRIAALRAARELEPVDTEPDDAAVRVRRALLVERAELRYRLTKKGASRDAGQDRGDVGERTIMDGDYAALIARKSIRDIESGLSEVPPLASALKPFQAAIVSWAVRRGRAAIFAGTGLGKTLMQLSWANVVAEEAGRVLILCPLAVAEQTVAEAAKFGIADVAYAADRNAIKTGIVVTNYERFEKFDITRFSGIVLDESGIIKSDAGKIGAMLTEACRDVPWRLCCTATPAPNDYTELGQHSEFLGVMAAKEMLATFFVHDGSIRANDHSQGKDGWRLKGHATEDFWAWLASWSVMVRHPRDFGFEEDGYDLPPLHLHQETVRAEYKPTGGELFPTMASTLSQRIGVRRDTVAERVARSVEIINRKPDEPWLIWANLNAEADAIEKLLPRALQVSGTHKPEIKVQRLLGFTKGDPLQLVTKHKIAARGMNYQHCANMLMIGLTDSFEAIYQGIRRCWRFGQWREVHVYFVSSELEGNVVANLKRKEEAFEAMLDAMASHMRDLMVENVTGGRSATEMMEPTIEMELPTWLR